MNPFETETMAELCVRQGHLEDALGIYQRLLQRAPDAGARVRLEDGRARCRARWRRWRCRACGRSGRATS